MNTSRSAIKPPATRLAWKSIISPAERIFLGLLFTSVGLRLVPRVLAEDDTPNDRAGAFQVLADGTQDLAALVGLFATDSVERYAVDYSRGYLSAAMATCSLLGILGYVRALVKVAMGSQSCQDSAFPTGKLYAFLLYDRNIRIRTCTYELPCHSTSPNDSRRRESRPASQGGT